MSRRTGAPTRITAQEAPAGRHGGGTWRRRCVWTLAGALATLAAACGDSPTAPQPGIEWVNISVTNIDVRTSAVDVGTVTIVAPAPGYVVVRFDGQAAASPGDMLVLAASNTSAAFTSNDGNVGFMGGGPYATHSFSHTRVYEVPAGSSTFYAVAWNFVETGGNGRASVYGTLSAAYYSRRY